MEQTIAVVMALVIITALITGCTNNTEPFEKRPYCIPHASVFAHRCYESYQEPCGMNLRECYHYFGGWQKTNTTFVCQSDVPCYDG